MSSSGGAGKLGAALLGLAVIAGGVVAFRYSQKQGAAEAVEHEARVELVRFALGVARCAANKHNLPETGPRVPARLVDVSGKRYANGEQDWQDASFSCASFRAPSPQSAQYRWRKLTEQSGRVEARADIDGDGKPDKWFEIEVRCAKSSECTAVNYVSEVTVDGLRKPPGILSWLRRAATYLGEPPSLEADDDANPSPASSELAAPPPRPLAVVTSGAPSSLDTLYFEAERRATTKLSGAVLLTLEYKNARGALANAADGTTLHGLYGKQDAKGWVHRGEDVVHVSFDQRGMSEVIEKAPRDLHGQGFAECLPEKLLAAVAPPASATLDLTLAWNVKHERALWSVKQAKTTIRTYGADHCALVK